MFSVNQKRQISDAVQKILRETDHPELPTGEISFSLHVDGAESWSWADIRNNSSVPVPDVNPHNEYAASLSAPQDEGWVKIVEGGEMPEVGEMVQVTIGEDTVLQGRLMINGWAALFLDGEKLVDDLRPVRAWRKLPSPPTI